MTNRHRRAESLVALCLMLGLLVGHAPAQADVVFDFEGETDTSRFEGQDAEFAIVDRDGGKGLQITYTGAGSYPGLHLRPAKGNFDFSGAGGISVDVTNTSDKRLRVHVRADNPGDWRQQPWSVNAQSVDPGKTVTIRVPFGRSYGNPGYKLDPSKVSAIVIFIEKPGQQRTLVVDNIQTFAASGESSATGDEASRGGGGAAVAGTPPASNTLYDFEGDVDLSRFVGDGTRHELVDVAGGRALLVTFESGRYPGVQLNAPGHGWNLSNFAGVEVELTNVSDQKLTVAMRIDNPGNWKDEPWNVEKTSLNPGQTRTLRVKFGQSWGAPGFALNPARVVRALVYAERPKAGAQIRIDNLRAYGQPMVREVDTLDLEGMLFDFGPSFIPAGRVEERGATARVEGGRLIGEFTEGSWPAVALKPMAKQWDLSNFESVQAELTNLGKAPVRMGLRVDNPGRPENSNTELETIKPGETKVIKVTFGQSWGKPGYKLDPSKVTAVLVYAGKPNGTARVAVDNIKANRRPWAEVPEWIGTRPPVEGDWVQTLDENFDGPKLDEKLWTPRLVWDGPAKGELQRYIVDNVYIEDGKLVIKCERNPGHQYDNPQLERREYATGAVTSLDKWTQRYGYFEARIKAPTARGLWPAFWMMPDRGPGNGDIWQRRSTERGGMEIDIWEHLTEWGPHRYNVAAHWEGYGKDHKQWGNAHIYHLPTPDGWHNYGLLWEPGKLTWFADGRKVAEWKDDRVTDVPLYLKFTVQMGNWATTDVDVAALPDYLQVDYVRAWQLRERLEDR